MMATHAYVQPSVIKRKPKQFKQLKEMHELDELEMLKENWNEEFYIPIFVIT